MLCEIYAYVHSHLVLQSSQVKRNPKMVEYLRSGAKFFCSLGATFWRWSMYMFYFIFWMGDQDDTKSAANPSQVTPASVEVSSDLSVILDAQ